MGYKASATVITSTPCKVYHLSIENMKKMEEKDPDLAAEFHKSIAMLMVERLKNTNETLRVLLD